MSLREEIDILIYIEHPSRELDLAALYAHLLDKNHGLKARLAPVFFRDYETFAAWDPKVVVLPNYYAPSKGSERTRAFFPKARFLNLSSEQIFSRLNFDRKAPKGEFALHKLHYLAWSQGYRDYLAEKGVSPDKVTVTGNPTYSLYREPWKAKFERRKELAQTHNLDLTKRWMFFPENYGAAWFSESQREKMVANGADREGVETNHSNAMRSLEAVCAWLHHIPQDVELILRPRPATGTERFLELAGKWMPKNQPGLKIIEDGTVREWILASEGVISSYSTSLIEAAVAGKPIAMLQPYPMPAVLQNEFFDLVHTCRTSADWSQVMNDMTLADPGPLADWAESNFMAQGDPVMQVVAWLASHAVQADGQWKPTKSIGRRAMAKDLVFKAKKALKGRGERRLAADDLSREQAEKAVSEWKNF